MYLGDEILHNYVGMIISHEIRIPANQRGFLWTKEDSMESKAGFFSCLICCYATNQNKDYAPWNEQLPPEKTLRKSYTLCFMNHEIAVCMNHCCSHLPSYKMIRIGSTHVWCGIVGGEFFASYPAMEDWYHITGIYGEPPNATANPRNKALVRPN